MRAAMLALLCADENRNATYTMRQTSDRFFETEFCRVGADPYKMVYPMSRWEAILSNHLAEGYVLRGSEESEEGRMYKKIADPEVRELVNKLIRASRRVIEQYYAVSPSLVTKEMLAKAQALILRLNAAESVDEANATLKELATIIPRKMADVSSELFLPSIYDLERIVGREQELLDLMAAEAETEARKAPDQTILDAYGLSIRRCTKHEEGSIVRHLGSSEKYFSKGFRIQNKLTDARFDANLLANELGKDAVHFLYHGSTNPNWFSILSKGLLLNPDAPITGKMFGYGLYFANDAHKSIGYTSLSGSRWADGRERTAYLGVAKVAYQNPLHVDEPSGKLSCMTGESLAPYDAVVAHKGPTLKKDEIIVYREAQATWQYLIELKMPK